MWCAGVRTDDPAEVGLRRRSSAGMIRLANVRTDDPAEVGLRPGCHLGGCTLPPGVRTDDPAEVGLRHFTVRVRAAVCQAVRTDDPAEVGLRLSRPTRTMLRFRMSGQMIQLK